MDFVLWHNILSIHQAPFICELASRYRVLLVVEREIDEKRALTGWNIPDMGDAKIIVSPSIQQVSSIVKHNLKATHFFTGISAFPMVYEAFKVAVRSKVQIFLHMEPYENIGWRSMLRYFYYRWLSMKYSKSISAIFATGRTGVHCYTAVGFRPSTIFEWGYFTAQNKITCCNAPEGDDCRVLYIGRLDHNKQVLSLIEEIKSIKRNKVTLTIIGTGPLEQEVAASACGAINIKNLGNVPNGDIHKYMLQNDLLVLPSRYDGWGAVINEALNCGTRVLCSSSCGASCLIDGIKRGSVFSWSISGDFKKHLDYWVERGRLTQEERANIASWASHSISAQAAVDYVCAIKSHLYCMKNTIKPIAPWNLDK